MKTVNKLLSVLMGCALLISCSNKPPLPKSKVVDTNIIDLDNGSRITIITKNAINGDVIEDTDNRLNLVSKAENAKLIALKSLQIAATLLGGGGSSINGHSKEQLKGTYIESVKNKTMDYLTPELRKTLENLNVQTGENPSIIVQPYKYKIIYEGLGNNDYEFIYSTTIHSGDFRYVCSSSNLLSTERVQSIDKWQENNYELTQSLTKKIIENCFSEINESKNKERLKNALLKKP